MKQVLLTRNQLLEITAEETGKLVGEIAEKDPALAMLFTMHDAMLSIRIVNRLFGEPDEDDIKNAEERCEQLKRKLGD